MRLRAVDSDDGPGGEGGRTHEECSDGERERAEERAGTCEREHGILGRDQGTMSKPAGSVNVSGLPKRTAAKTAAPLTRVETAILARALAGKQGCDGVLDPDVRARLRAVRPPGFGAALAAGLRWRVREAAGRDPVRAARLAALALGLSPAAAITGRVAAAPGVEERDSLPAEAYAW